MRRAAAEYLTRRLTERAGAALGRPTREGLSVQGLPEGGAMVWWHRKF